MKEELDVFSDELKYNNATIKTVEETVIRKAIQGEKEAFEKIFIVTYRYVFTVCRSYLKNEQDTYDAIQDTYVSVLSSIKNLRDTESFYPWLARIAQNSSFSVWNKNHPGVAFEDQMDNIKAEDEEDFAVSADVTAVLKELPAEQVELLVRLYYDKFTVTEIAKILGLPRTTVSNRIKAAKKNLKEKLKLRGIEKPIYSGEVISMISNALRYAIGTRLLSMAVAQEILNRVTGSKNKKSAAIIIAIAQNQRNTAALKIAGLLLLGSVLMVGIIFASVLLLLKAGAKDTATVSSTFSGISASDNKPTTEPDKPSAEPTTSNEDSTEEPDATSKPEQTQPGQTPSVGEPTQPTPTPPQSTVTPDDEEEITEPTPPVQEPESDNSEVIVYSGNLGTYVENRDCDIAITNSGLFAVANGDLVTLSSSAVAPKVLIDNFDAIYGDGYSLNVFEDKVYWINKNSSGKFVLNRCNINGTNHYSVVFNETDCTILTNMVVAEDGVYFVTGGINSGWYKKIGSLYRTDTNFNIEKQISDVVDYTISGDKIYCLFGYDGVGDLHYIDRKTFGNKSEDRLISAYAEVYLLGDLLVAGPYGKNVFHEEFPADLLRVLDPETGDIVHTVWWTDFNCTVKDVSEENGGIITFKYGKYSYLYHLQGEETERISCGEGTIYGGYRYYVSSGRLYRSGITGDSQILIY